LENEKNDLPSLEEMKQVAEEIKAMHEKDELTHYDHGVLLILETIFETDVAFRDIIARFIATWEYLVQYANPEEMYLFYNVFVGACRSIVQVMEEKKDEEVNEHGTLS
jgi:hypothetical protein